MRRTRNLMVVCLLGVSLAGCSSSANAPTEAVPSTAAPPPTPAEVDPPMLGGVLATSVGLGLENGDRVAAFQAQTSALETGQRQSWSGQRGVYGFVEVGAAQGACRPYSQTVYVAARPYQGQGTACKQADGAWRMTP